MNELKWDKKDGRMGGRVCVTDMVFLKYGDAKVGSICVEFEYIESDNSMNYLDICYSDPDLERHVEGNPSVLRNVDAYIRNNLLKQEFNYSFA